MATTTVIIKLGPNQHRTLVTELREHADNLSAGSRRLKQADGGTGEGRSDARKLDSRAATIESLLADL